MKWNIKSKRFLALLLIDLIWVAVGFMANQWEVFQAMIYPVIALNAGYLGVETFKKSDG